MTLICVNNMQDLEIAKKLLVQKQLTLVIAKNGQVLFETDSRRISGFLGAIDKLGASLKDASVADRVAGKALALLCVYAGVRGVYAEVLSRKAEVVFGESKVLVEWKEIVDNVLNDDKTGMCPFEKVADEISDPQEAYGAMKALMKKMRACR
jgi:hypothetical protein